MSDTAYKIADAAEWRVARAAGAYDGSSVDRADGYIHMSTAEQLAETARRHYGGRRDLIVARIDLAGLGQALKWEASRGGALFPHLYGFLPMTAVSGEREADVDADGRLVFHDGEHPWP